MSPNLFNLPPRSAMVCPRCGRVFEIGFDLDGKEIAGHPVGHPRICEPLPTQLPYGGRDVRERKRNRRGRR